MQPSEITEALNCPISQEPPARDMSREGADRSASHSR